MRESPRTTAVAVSTNSLLEERARVQHMLRGCVPTRAASAAVSAQIMVKTSRVNSSNKQQNVLWCTIQNQEPRSASIASSTHRFHSLALCHPPSKKKTAGQELLHNCTAFKKSLHHRNNLLLDLRSGHAHSLFESALLYSLLWNRFRSCGTSTSTIWSKICGIGTPWTLGTIKNTET